MSSKFESFNPFKSFNWTITPVLNVKDLDLWTLESQDVRQAEEALVKEAAVKIVHSLPTPRSRGFTLAWRKTSTYKNCTMVDVAVAYCAPGDTFTKKIGAEIASRNLAEGRFVTVPARNPLIGDTSVPHKLRRIFTLESFPIRMLQR